MITNNYKKNTMWTIILLVILSIPLSNNEYYYYFGVVIMTIIGLYDNHFVITVSKKREQDMFPVVMIIIWLFGVLTGIIRQYPYEYIFRNFAGTLCYFLYYTMPDKALENKKRLRNVLVLCSLIACVYVCIASFLYTRVGVAIWPFNIVQYNVHTNSVLSSVGVLAFVLEAVSIHGFMNSRSVKDWIINIVLFGLSFYSAIKTNDMGGYLLGFVAIFLITVVVSLFQCGQRKMFILLFVFLIVAIAFELFYYKNTKTTILTSIFSTADEGNVKRMLQINLVLDRFKLLGNGIGAPFNYALGSKIYNTYSIEVSYLNCLDKYGILAIPMFYVLIKSIIIPIKNIWNKIGNQKDNIIAIALMGYLFIALGNPVLFAPYNVIIHCVSLKLSQNKT